MPSSLERAAPGRRTSAGLVDWEPVRSDGLLRLFGGLLGVLLVGYLFFDKAFAYLHLPGVPLYIGEIVLIAGILGVLASTRYLRVAVMSEPLLALLAAFFLWGLVRFLPGLPAYGIDAVHDFAVVYYCLFAFLIAAVLARSLHFLERLLVQFGRFVPWLLVWLPVSLVLAAQPAPSVPGTPVSVLTHKPGNVAIAALLALGFLWLFTELRSPRSRTVWSGVALLVIALAGTQNRGGLLGALAGAFVGLVFCQDRWRLVMRTAVVLILALGLTTLLAVQLPVKTFQGRTFSASQLFANVASIGGEPEPGGNLAGTVGSRKTIWTRVIDAQEYEGRITSGYGFGLNLTYLVGDRVTSARTGATRNPHNSHLDVLARMGVVGLFLWIFLWGGWYYRLVAGCRRLAHRGLYTRRKVAVLCLMVTSAILVSSFFDPQLEGAQIAALLWTTFGIGIAVTSFRGWIGDRDLQLALEGRRGARTMRQPAQRLQVW